jgi:hypothetical protein
LKGRKDLFFKNRYPRLAQIYPVYAIIVSLVYGWTIYWSFWKLPSWMDFLPLGGIASIYCYLLMANFFESLLVLLGAVIVSLILPPKWFRDVFVSRASVLAASVLISFAFFESHFIKPAEYFHELPIYLVPIMLVGGILGFLAGWIPIVRKGVEILAENAVIFLYISVPLSLLALAVVIVRNLFTG